MRAMFRSLSAVALAFAGLVAAFALLRFSPAFAGSTIRYVAPGGAGAAPCADRAAPCPSIQTALDAALPGDLVKVAAGVYTENLVMTRAVILRGGYTPADDFATSFPLTRETTIRAAGGGPVISMTNAATATVEGFTITGGNASWGGGILIEQSQPRIADNLITGNSATLGGGICVYHGGLPGARIVGNRIEGNTAWVAGGVLVWGGAQDMVDSNQICHNSATSYAGGLFLLAGQDYVVRANRIYSNTAGRYGGGLLLDYGQGHLVDSNQVTHNTTHDTGWGQGGGIDVENTLNFTITNNLIALNRLGITAPYCCEPLGEGIFIGGDYLPPSGVLVNNTIVSNSLGVAGEAVAVTRGTITLTNNIIVSHTVGITAAAGTTVTHAYNLFYANASDYGGSVSGPTSGEFNADPLFVPGPGPMGDFYLSQVSAGQGQDSPALDAGDRSAAAAGLALRTTHTEEGGDAGTVDLGYHYAARPFALELVANPSVIAANGISTTTLTAELFTEAGHPVPDGNPILFSSPHGDFENGIQSYTASTTGGIARAVLRSAPASVTLAVTVSALAEPAAGSTLVLFQAPAQAGDTLFLPLILKGSPPG